MKRTLFIIVAILCAMSCKAQLIYVPEGIIPIEDLRTYQEEIPDGAYIKDIHHLLDKYEGTWVGEFNDKTYKIVINQTTRSFSSSDITADVLLLRYKITDSNGQVLFNTLDLADDNNLVVLGNYMENGGEASEYYVLGYFGEESQCGQSGVIYIDFFDGDYNQLHLFLSPSREHILANDCPNGSAAQLFPTAKNSEGMMLTKQ